MGSRKTVEPWQRRWKISQVIPVPKWSSYLSSLLEKTGQPETDTLCKSVSGFVAKSTKKVFASVTVGCVFMIFSLLWGKGLPLARMGKRIIGSRLASLVRWALNWRTWEAGCKWQRLCHRFRLGSRLQQPLQSQMYLGCPWSWGSKHKTHDRCLWLWWILSHPF